MKEVKDSPSRGSNGLLEPSSRLRQHRLSTSSRLSGKSNTSQESRKTHKSRRRGRPRGLSFSSVHSQAVSMHSAVSADTNNLSRKTSHADDSAASDTNESLGETEEDVWFPTDARDNGDINVDELDQLLGLSDEEQFDPNKKPFRTPGFSVGGSGSSGSHTELSKVHADKTTDHHGIYEGHNLDGTVGPDIGYHHGGLQAETGATATGAAAVDDIQGTDSQSNRRKFVEYHRPVEDESNSNSSSGGDSAKKPPGSFRINVENVDENDKSPVIEPDFHMEEKHSSSNEMRPIRKVLSNPQLGASRENTNLGADDQPSQRYSFFAAGLENTIHAPDLASLVGKSDSFSSLFKPENGTWFLDCFRPTDLEMRALSRAFGIHPLTAEDIQTEDAREKFESFKNYYLVVYHTFENDKEDPRYMRAINFYMLVFKEGVISFHFEPVSHCRNVRRRMRQLRDYLNFTSDWIAYALIDDITDSFAPEIQSVEKEADFVEDAVYLDDSGSTDMSTLLRRLGEGRRHTMHLIRMLSGKADVVRGFAKRVNERNMSSEMSLYLGDIQDHIVTMYQNLSAYEKIFSRSHFNYMGLLQMEFVDSSNRMTGVLGKVTILGTVLVPMNLVTGLFGMNVHVPGQNVESFGWFFGILGVILLSVVVLLFGSIFYVKFTMNSAGRRGITAAAP